MIFLYHTATLKYDKYFCLYNHTRRPNPTSVDKQIRNQIETEYNVQAKDSRPSGDWSPPSDTYDLIVASRIYMWHIVTVEDRLQMQWPYLINTTAVYLFIKAFMFWLRR